MKKGKKIKYQPGILPNLLSGFYEQIEIEKKDESHRAIFAGLKEEYLKQLKECAESKKLALIAEILLIIIGAFLSFDSVYLHAITFDYSSLGLEWLDPFFSHGVLGVILIVVGLISAYFTKRRSKCGQ